MKILKSLDPHYLVHRLATDQIVGVLADRDLGEIAGADMLLADGEVDAGAEPHAHAEVRLRKGVRFASGEVAVSKLGDKLDPFMARTFASSDSEVWFHPLALVDEWEESVVVKGLDVPTRIRKSEVDVPDEDAVAGLTAADLGAVARLLDANPEVDGAEEMAMIVKSEYDRRGLDVDESLRIFKGLWAYPAGKAALAKRLVEMMPVHKVYVEPFIGSGAVLFAKEKAPVEVVNDYDEEVAEAWRMMSKLSEPDLKRLCGMNWTGDRDTFMRMKKEGGGGDDVVKLHRFFYLSRFAYGAMRGKSFSPGMQGRVLTMPRKLEKNIPRVAGVRAFHGDYEDVCRKFDGPNTFHFMDPPYAGYNTNVGEAGFDEARFFKMLTELKGKWIVTYGVRGDLPKMLKDSPYTVVKVNTRRSIRTMRGVAGDDMLKQIIAYNYELPGKGDPDPEPEPEPSPDPVEDEKKKLTPNLAVEKEEAGAPAAVLCFYHADLDGIASAAVVLQAHPDAEVVSINYGQEFDWESIKGREKVFMVDYAMQPFDEMVKLKAEVEKEGGQLIWIDHHVTALEAAEKAGFEAEGIREVGQAGCELTWKWLHPDEPAPEVIRLAGRFDVWDHEDPNVLPVHFAMEAIKEANDPGSKWWSEWLQKGEGDFGELVSSGQAIQGWLEEFSAGRMRFSSFDVEFGGLSCVAACTSLPGSMQFEAVKADKDAAISFCFSPGNQWDVSMYALKEGVDVGKVCADNGGGGHAGAGGFQAKKLPFELPVGTEKGYDIREQLAAYAHSAWSRWMRHVFERGDSISTEDAERWKRQMETPYSELSEEEKESDRAEADHMLEVLSGRGDGIVKAAIDAAAALEAATPSDDKSFDGVSELLEGFATAETLAAGIGVGPKWNGRLAVVQASGGAATIAVAGAEGDQSGALPGIAADVAKLGDGAALVGEVVEADIGAVLMVRDILMWEGKDQAEEPWATRQKILNQAVPKATNAIAPSPIRMVHSEDNLKAAIKWASEIPGAVGVVVSGGESKAAEGAVAEVKMPRIVNALVVGQEPAGDDAQMFQCAVGPLSESESGRMKETLEIGGRKYTPIGSTSPSKVDASEGDVLRLEVGEILVIDSDDSAAIGWDTSKVLERVHVKPATVSEIRALARPHEIQKLCKILKRDSERHYVLSVVLEPNDGEDGAPLDPDAHAEIYSEDEVWDACVYWHEQGASLGVMHEREASRAEMLPVHNFIAPVDMEIDGEVVRAGSWLIGSIVLSAALWQRIDSGELNAWSVDGRALRRPEAIAA